MPATIISAGALARAAPLADADWAVKKLQFSAVSVGVAFIDDKTGWSSFTDGASAIKLVKTTDGGNTWNPVKNQSGTGMVMGGDPGGLGLTPGSAELAYSNSDPAFEGHGRCRRERDSA